MVFYIVHEDGGQFAARAPEGKFMSPQYTAGCLSAAEPFDSWGDASDVSQNFGPEWGVEEF